METSIAGMLILGVLSVAIVLLANAVVVSNTVVGTAVQDAANLEAERANTRLTFEAATSTSTTLDVDVTNAGSVSVTGYSKVDVIVEYLAIGGNSASTHLTYTTSATPPANEWTVVTTTPSWFQPGSWDAGEMLTLRATLSPSLNTSSTTSTVTVATPNGIAVSGTIVGQ